MIETLQALACSDKQWAAQRAQLALDITAQFQEGQISPDEYRELLADLVRSDRLDAEADDLEVKTLLVTGIYGLAQII